MAWHLNSHNCSKIHGMSILLKCFGLSFILNRKLGIHALLRHQRYLKHVHDNILQPPQYSTSLAEHGNCSQVTRGNVPAGLRGCENCSHCSRSSALKEFGVGSLAYAGWVSRGIRNVQK